MKPVRKQIQDKALHQPADQVMHQVDVRVDWRIRVMIYDPVKWRIKHLIYDQVWYKVWDQLF